MCAYAVLVQEDWSREYYYRRYENEIVDSLHTNLSLGFTVHIFKGEVGGGEGGVALFAHIESVAVAAIKVSKKATTLPRDVRGPFCGTAQPAASRARGHP